MADPTRATLWLKKKDLCIFILYIFILVWEVYFYHPWEDEGRSWMISRAYDIHTIFFHVLHYEGHPVLWYLVLWVPIHLHLPYHYINWISSSIATAGIYILLKYSPFPFFLRALIPFGFALQYQYAVVARSYVLFPILGFVCAHLYRKKKKNPIVMGIALAFFANIVIYSTAVAVGLGFCYWWKVAREKLSSEPVPMSDRRSVLGLTIFASSLMLVAWCIWPPPYLRARLIDAWSHGHSASVVTLPLEAPASNPGLSAYAGGKTGSPPIESTSYSHRIAIRLYPVLADSVASYYPLAFVFEALIVAYLLRKRDKIFILPIALLVASLLMGYEQTWHVQMLWVTLIIVLWMVWEEQKEPLKLSPQSMVSAFLAVLCILQLQWTFSAIRYEMHHSTYPAEEAAHYVSTLHPSTRIGGTGLAFTLNPYFAQDIFTIFSENNLSIPIAFQPDILIEDSRMSGLDSNTLADSGYHEIKSFCGGPYLPNHPIQSVCLIFFEKAK